MIRQERAALGISLPEPGTGAAPQSGHGSAQISALCLSGGGIRSATFNLGLLQSLARAGRLTQFHYLSTVSGGGYIGAWLSAWIARVGKDGVATVQAMLADGCAGAGGDAASEPVPIRRLRAYSNFLSPVRGMSGDSFALAATFLRNLLLHWAVMIPILVALLLLPRALFGLLEHGRAGGASASLGSEELWWLVAVMVFCSKLYMVLDLPVSGRARGPAPGTRLARFALGYLAPFVTAVLLLLYLAYAQAFVPRATELLLLCTAGAMVFAAASLAGIGLGAVRLRGSLASGEDRSAFLHDSMWHLIFNASAGGVAGAAVAAALRLMASVPFDVATATTFGPLLLLSAFWLASTVGVGLSRRKASEEAREWWARSTGALLAAGLGWTALSMLVIQLPGWLFSLLGLSSGVASGVAGVGGIVLAVATAAYGFWSRHGVDIRRHAATFGSALGIHSMELAAIASMLVLLVMANLGLTHALVGMRAVPWHTMQPSYDRVTLVQVCSPPKGAGAASGPGQCENNAACRSRPSVVTPAQRQAACEEVLAARSGPRSSEPAWAWAKDPGWTGGEIARHLAVLRASSGPRMLALAAILVAVAALVSWASGANAFSLSAMYGNRLTRAYLGASSHLARSPTGASSPGAAHPFTGFDPSDNLALRELLPASNQPCLFPVFNAALNLLRPSGDRLEWQQRKAAPFVMTPLHCGSASLGYVSTTDYGRTPQGISVGRAIAVSGAAVSPSMGYHSSPAVSALLSLFNVRLGWWMPNPRFCGDSRRDEPLFGIGPMLQEALSRTSEHNGFVYVSDGGHFENLGLYEMVRRRCTRILVVDAGADPEYRFADVENAIRRVRVDFGADISFAGGLPTPAWAERTGRHYAVGSITYPDVGGGPASGVIVLVKPVLSGDEPFDVRCYAEASHVDNRQFPQQSTSDQFFDEAQFESYRALGCCSLDRAFFDSVWPGPDAAEPSRPASDQPGARFAMRTSIAPGDMRAREAPGGEGSERAGGIGGWLSSLGSFGQAAIMATAVSVAVTVTGHVTLSNPEVRIANPELRLSGGGAPGGDQPALTSAPEIQESITDVSRRVSEELDDVVRAIDRLQIDQDASSDVLARIRQVVDALAQSTLALAAAADGLNDSSVRIGASTQSLDRAAGDLSRLASPTLRNVADTARDLHGIVVDLESVIDETRTAAPGLVLEIQKSLREIEVKLEEMSPSNNTRGG